MLDVTRSHRAEACAEALAIAPRSATCQWDDVAVDGRRGPDRGRARLSSMARKLDANRRREFVARPAPLAFSPSTVQTPSRRKIRPRHGLRRARGRPGRRRSKGRRHPRLRAGSVRAGAGSPPRPLWARPRPRRVQIVTWVVCFIPSGRFLVCYCPLGRCDKQVRSSWTVRGAGMLWASGSLA